MAVLHHLEYQNAMLLAMMNKLGLNEEEAIRLGREHFNGEPTQQ
jgi:hypothetical protein